MSRPTPLRPPEDPYALPQISAAEAGAYEAARRAAITMARADLVILLVSMGGEHRAHFGPNFMFAVASRGAADAYMNTHADLAFKTYPFSDENLEMVKSSPHARVLFSIEGDMAGAVWRARLLSEVRHPPSHGAHCTCPECHAVRGYLR
jgi:hypothetical protein